MSPGAQPTNCTCLWTGRSRLNLRSLDVLHDFAVPQFRVKMDLVPGLVTYVWFTPTRTGKFDILCMELCGIAHYAMRGHVVVDEQAEFETWLAQQPTWGETQGLAAPDSGGGQGPLRSLRPPATASRVRATPP